MSTSTEVPPPRVVGRQSLLAPLLTVVGAAWYALWACAPMSTMPPPGAMGDNKNEFELAGNGTFGDTTSAGYSAPGTGGSVQLSYAHRFNHLTLGGGIYAGSSSMVGGGVTFGGLFPVGRIQLGFQASGGFLWGEVGMPVTIPLGDRVWLYTEPSVGVRARVLRLPIGAGFRLGDHVTLAPEIAAEYLSLGTTARAYDSVLVPGLGLTGALSLGAGF